MTRSILPLFLLPLRLLSLCLLPLCVLGLCVLGRPVMAAVPADPAWTITVDPLTTAIGFVHVQIERRLDPHLSLYVGPNLRLYDGILPDVNGPYRGLGVEAGLRVFPWGAAPTGVWLMLRGVGAALSTTGATTGSTTGAAAPATAPGGYTSLLVGGTILPVGPLVLSGGLGLSWFSYQVGGYGASGFLPAAHSNLGVAF